MEPEALVFIHQGLPSYLICSLSQARAMCPGQRIILVSDQKPKLDVEWHNIRNFDQEWQEMAQAYVHLSTNVEKFERFCFYRWFILRGLMDKLGIQKVIHLDSDVMIYYNPFIENANISSSLPAWCSTSSHSPHFCYIPNVEVISKICAAMILVFRDCLDELKSHYQKQLVQGGGVCDMYVFGWLIWNNRMKYKELCVIESGITFDHSLNASMTAGQVESFQMDKNGNKIIAWKNKIPHFVSNEGEFVRAMIIHCQGSRKKMIPLLWRMKTIQNQFVYWIVKFEESLGIYYHCFSRRLYHLKNSILKRMPKVG